MTQPASHGPHLRVEHRYLDEVRRYAQAESLVQSHAALPGQPGRSAVLAALPGRACRPSLSGPAAVGGDPLGAGGRRVRRGQVKDGDGLPVLAPGRRSPRCRNRRS